MNVHRLLSADRVALEKLRGQVLVARRWHHSQIQKLDAAWSGVPAEIAASAPSQRAARLELARRQIAKLTAIVPPSAFDPESAAAASEAPEQLS
jgi:hypothetical protein